MKTKGIWSLFVYTVLAMAVFLLWIPGAKGLPVVDRGRTIGGLLCFPDESAENIWWYAPRGIVLAGNDEHPAFTLHRFLYEGSPGESTGSEFWTHSLLSISIRSSLTQDGIAEAGSLLAASVGQDLQMRPVSDLEIEAHLPYVVIGDAGTTEAGELPRGKWPDFDPIAGAGTYMVGLDPITTSILWNAYQNGSVALSVSYSIRALGVVGTSEDLAAPTSDPEISMNDIKTAISAGAIPVEVSPRVNPGSFRTSYLSAVLDDGYPTVEVFCFELGNRHLGVDLQEVRVEIEAMSSNGRDLLRQTVLFSTKAPNEYMKTISFQYPVKVKQGYRHRVTHIRKKKEDSGSWQRCDEWHRVLDVTTYRAESAMKSTLNPRELF